MITLIGYPNQESFACYGSRWPYYRKAQDRWVCTIDGNRVTLGQDKKAAFEQFHKLMADRGAVKASVHTACGLTQVYLDWVEVNRSAGTYDNHKRCLKSFIESIGKTLKVAELRNHHVTKWVDAQEWNSATKNDNISTVFRVINWAMEQGYINSSPLRKMKKPKRTRREVHYTDEQWSLIKIHIKTKQFADFLDFIWATGCRPKEARNLEARHVDMVNDLILIPAAEAKGGIPRVIYMTPESKQILQRVWKDSGKVFETHAAMHGHAAPSSANLHVSRIKSASESFVTVLVTLMRHAASRTASTV